MEEQKLGSNGKLPEIEIGTKSLETIIKERIETAVSDLSNVPDESVKYTATRGKENPEKFEDDTELVALGWRMDPNSEKISSLLKDKPRLRFYVTFKALNDTLQTETEYKSMDVQFEEVTKEWREALTDEMINEAKNLNELSAEDRIGKLDMFRDLGSRCLAHVELMSIDKLVDDGEAYSTKAIGESYLTLEQVERVGKALLEGSVAERLFATEDEKKEWGVIGRTYQKVWIRREENNRLVEDFFKKTA